MKVRRAGHTLKSAGPSTSQACSRSARAKFEAPEIARTDGLSTRACHSDACRRS